MDYLFLFNVCVFFFLPVVAPEPERPGPATHFRAQQRDGDGGGEEVPLPQLAQPLPQLEHRRQVRGPGCDLGVGFLPPPPHCSSPSHCCE